MSDAHSLVKTSEFYERHRVWAAVALAATVASAAVGLYIGGLLGAILGVLLGAIASYVGPRSVIKRVDTERIN